MILDSYLYSIAGGRSYNEDCVGKKDLPDGAVYVLADGLGGHRHGELASKCVVESLLNAEIAVNDSSEPQNIFEEPITVANDNLLELQRKMASNMKSTVVALAVCGDSACWANVGDSRLYYIHKKEIESITEDHSVAYKKYRAGEITRAQIGMDEDQSRLLRTLGSKELGKIDFSSAFQPLEAGDGFLLCSDGFWEYVYDNEILFDFLKAESAQEWAELMLVRAMERIQPENDNLSLITVFVK